MTRSSLIGLIRHLLALVIAIMGLFAPPATAAKPDKLLIFHLATGFRHDSIPDGVAAIQRMAKEAGLKPASSDDPAIFDQPMDDLAAVVLVSTTTDPKRPDSEWFTGPRANRFRRYVEGGGGVVAIHAAADSHYNWPWYARAIGCRFDHHPAGTPVGRVMRTATRHPAQAELPSEFTIADEWYWYGDVAPELDHLLTLDPASVGAKESNPRPLAWVHEVGKGRVFYTGLGHRKESWRDPRVLAHVAAGLRWAATGSSATVAREKVTP